jgi:hypothetical protein
VWTLEGGGSATPRGGPVGILAARSRIATRVVGGARWRAVTAGNGCRWGVGGRFPHRSAQLAGKPKRRRGKPEKGEKKGDRTRGVNEHQPCWQLGWYKGLSQAAPCCSSQCPGGDAKSGQLRKRPWKFTCPKALPRCTIHGRNANLGMNEMGEPVSPQARSAAQSKKWHEDHAPV